jgi:hypothetical protein
MIKPTPGCWPSGQKALSQATCDAIDREPDGGEILVPAISALDIAVFVEDVEPGLPANVRMAPVAAGIASWNLYCARSSLARSDIAPEAERHHGAHVCLRRFASSHAQIGNVPMHCAI